MAGIALVVLVLVLRLEAPGAHLSEGGGAKLAWGLVGGFVLLFFLYVATEGGVAAWETEYLTPTFGAVAAAGFTSLFWGAMTVGRFLATPLSALVRPPVMVLSATALTLVFMLLAHDVVVAPYYYAAVGLCLAPVFGTSLAWLTESFPRHAEQVTPIVVAAANLGPVITAPLIGVAVTAAGGSLIPTALSLLALLLVTVVAALFWRTRGQA
jgi:fucose permease